MTFTGNGSPATQYGWNKTFDSESSPHARHKGQKSCKRMNSVSSTPAVLPVEIDLDRRLTIWQYGEIIPPWEAASRSIHSVHETQLQSVATA